MFGRIRSAIGPAAAIRSINSGLVHTLGICPVAESLSSREKFVHTCCGGQKQILECSRMFAIGAVECSR